MQIQTEGVDNVSNILKNYCNGIERKLHRGLVAGARIVQSDAKALCPVSTEETRPGGPHGELRMSIHGQVDGTTAMVGTNKEYAAYVEFGTYKMAAQPYLVPALIGKQSDVIAVIVKEFKG